MIGRRAALRLTAAAVGMAGYGARAMGDGAWPGDTDTVDGAMAGGHEALARLAADLARAPHRATDMVLHPPFSGLDYDAHRGIRPRPGAGADISLGPLFRADVLPPGNLLNDRVRLWVGGKAGPELQEIPFDPGLFTFEPRYFGPDVPAMAPQDAAAMGFAGLRLRHPINRPGVWDELAVFQGASYFRALGRGDLYGLSARGLAIATDGPGPEEFPVFSQLAVQAQGRRAEVAALMESPSATGAFGFAILPGSTTVMDVTVSLFPRRPLGDVGIAPLTSMFWFGAIGRAGVDDFRPAVHDSEALIIRTGAGERLWRPLSNPRQVETSSFLDNGPRGFGLWQPRGEFHQFQDAEAGYHRRPTAWVEPLEDWGRGSVMLVEIPTGDEFADNIVAFWRPADPLAPGRRHDFRYRLHWGARPDAMAADTPMPVVRAMSGRGILNRDEVTVVVDFAGLRQGIVPDLTVEGAGSHGLTVYGVPEAGVTRASFQLLPGASERAEIRLVLRDGAGRAMSDTWLHRWTRGRGMRP